MVVPTGVLDYPRRMITREQIRAAAGCLIGHKSSWPGRRVCPKSRLRIWSGAGPIRALARSLQFNRHSTAPVLSSSTRGTLATAAPASALRSRNYHQRVYLLVTSRSYFAQIYGSAARACPLASEINASISWLWDGGIHATLGDPIPRGGPSRRPARLSHG